MLVRRTKAPLQQDSFLRQGAFFIGSGAIGSNKTAKDSTVGIDNGRRHFFRASATVMGASALGVVPDSLRSAVWAQGSDAPELTELRVGFMPLTDCAPVIIAAEMGFDRQYGIKITPSKEPSWMAIRDKTLIGRALRRLLHLSCRPGGQAKRTHFPAEIRAFPCPPQPGRAPDHGRTRHRHRAVPRLPAGTPGCGREREKLAVLRRTACRDGLLLP